MKYFPPNDYLEYLSIKRVEHQFIVTGPVYEVLSAHDDVATDSLVNTGLQRPSDVIRERLPHPHHQGLGDAVHLGASDHLGIGKTQTGRPELLLIFFRQAVEICSTSQIMPAQTKFTSKL